MHAMMQITEGARSGQAAIVASQLQPDARPAERPSRHLGRVLPTPTPGGPVCHDGRKQEATTPENNMEATPSGIRRWHPESPSPRVSDGMPVPTPGIRFPTLAD
ncbi:hypothetical protein E4U54_002079 [Claviceps lovelessii]|nr:hypothetical protein E4U54_002079 [Claviceps lovelessii]